MLDLNSYSPTYKVRVANQETYIDCGSLGKIVGGEGTNFLAEPAATDKATHLALRTLQGVGRDGCAPLTAGGPIRYPVPVSKQAGLFNLMLPLAGP
jgi:hypothetical protein